METTEIHNPDGSVYVGQVCSCCKRKNGEGQLFLNSRVVYVGTWYHDLYNGYGELMHENGYYAGNFINGVKCGFGNEYNVNNQLVYSGYWHGNMYHGPGKIYSDQNYKSYLFCYGVCLLEQSYPKYLTSNN